jgi:hypothetical protein
MLGVIEVQLGFYSGTRKQRVEREPGYTVELRPIQDELHQPTSVANQVA